MSKSERICGRCNSIFDSEKQRNKHLQSCVTTVIDQVKGTITCKAPSTAIESAMEQLISANYMLTQGPSTKELQK